MLALHIRQKGRKPAAATAIFVVSQHQESVDSWQLTATVRSVDSEMIICGPTPPFASGLTTVNCQLTPDLEVRSRLPANRTRKPPLLFVHGGYADAWCWEPFFLPWFAAQGWPATAQLFSATAKTGLDEARSKLMDLLVA